MTASKGVKLALKLVCDYYAKADKAHSFADGAGSGIIGMLEVIESDVTKGISEMVTAEQTAVKSADVKYTNKEAASLDKKAAEMSTDIEDIASQ